MRSDDQLLAAWAGGDRDAGRDFYQRYAERVSRFFVRKTSDDLPDLVQRTFLKCLDVVRRGDPIDNPAAFLFTIARNELYDLFGRNARDRFDPEHTSLADVRSGISTRLDRHQREALLHAALARLPLDSQLALELYYWEDLAMSDVARVLGVTESAAINRIHRARKQLRESLADTPDAVQALETRPAPPELK